MMVNDKTILLVEDDLDSREALDHLLSDAGYEVISATSGRQAIEYLLADPSRPPDVVILDLMLPIVSGWRVLEMIRSDPRLAGIPVVVTTGISDRPPGADLVFRKPLHWASFLEEID